MMPDGYRASKCAIFCGAGRLLKVICMSWTRNQKSARACGLPPRVVSEDAQHPGAVFDDEQGQPTADLQPEAQA